MDADYADRGSPCGVLPRCEAVTEPRSGEIFVARGCRPKKRPALKARQKVILGVAGIHPPRRAPARRRSFQSRNPSAVLLFSRPFAVPFASIRGFFFRFLRLFAAILYRSFTLNPPKEYPR
jgi:hypothetical protein